jgi:O-antigen ligase
MHVSVSSQDHFFLVNVIALVVVNLLTFGYNLTGSSIFNLLGNALSMLLIMHSLYFLLFAKRETYLYTIIFLLSCTLVAVSLLINVGRFEVVDALKYISIYSFYLAGRNAPGHLQQIEKWCLYTLAALPFIFMLLGETKVYVDWSYPDVFAYFPNTNTAALYFSALLFSLSPWFGNKVLVVQFINVVMMNRVGAALATILAVGVWSIFPLRMQVLVALILLGLASCVAYALGALDRLVTGLDSIALILSLNPSTVARMSYKELVAMMGTTDVSAFFRIIHWTNIWDIYSSQGLGVLLFGYGAGQTKYLAYMPMQPHNDYLRILTEYGFLSFLVFLGFVVRVVFSIKLHAAKVIFTVLLIYFFSENLVDNFTSMALFFSYAGRFTSGRSLGSGSA